jgi:hypothetical protein
LGIHALLLDIDVGPLLQTQKLLDSVVFAQRRGVVRPLTGAELEVMNLTGDGNGLDLILMPAAMRTHVPTSNFFRRIGYEVNVLASRAAVVDRFFARIDAIMDREVNLPGAKDMAVAYAQEGPAGRH